MVHIIIIEFNASNFIYKIWMPPKKHIFRTNEEGLADAHEIAEIIKWVVISTEFKNMRTPMEFRCNRDHVNMIPLERFSEKRTCKTCTSMFGNLVQFATLRALAEKYGWLLQSDKYINNTTPLYFRCPEGHIRYILPKNFKVYKFDGPTKGCLACRGKDPITSKENFYENVAFLGGVVIDEYIGAHKGVLCKCKNGHLCTPAPSSIAAGNGMCITCVGCDPKEAEKAFNAKVAYFNGKVLSKYKNAHSKVKCICEHGHICYPTPTDVQQGSSICAKCAGRCTEQTMENFIFLMSELGYKIKGDYKTTKDAVRCICPKGHECFPRPGNVLHRGGLTCLDCAGRSPKMVEETFKISLQDAGYRIEGEYKLSHLGIKSICPFGHEIILIPGDVSQRGVRCRTCEPHGSYLEKIVREALIKMKVEFTEQYIPLGLKDLRFDFVFIHKGISCYIETDGEQHQNENSYFHRKDGAFVNARQRDLVKNYFIRQQPNTKLIRMDHTMFSDRKPKNRTFWINSIIEIINGSLAHTPKTAHKNIYFNKAIYSWVYDEPSTEFINKYIVTTEVKLK